jgi:hypothetical protein
MSETKAALPSREVLQAERERIKATNAQDRRVIARMRAGTVRAELQFANSFDRLADTQYLLRAMMGPHRPRQPCSGRGQQTSAADMA